jgi:hypothetical protein
LDLAGAEKSHECQNPLWNQCCKTVPPPLDWHSGFPDLSFVSKDFEYDALTESYRILNETYTSDELSALSSIFITKYRYNILILDNDYFKEDD